MKKTKSLRIFGHKVRKLEDLTGLLPKYTFSAKGKQMEPINLIILGNLKNIEDHFLDRGWYEAQKLRFRSALKGLWAGIFNKSYPEGPFASSFLGTKPFRIGFERPTHTNTFRRRHHLRLWKTPHKLKGKCVWAGTISYDKSIGRESGGFWPTHHVAPTLSWEQSFLARSLGIKSPKHLRLSHPEIKQSSNGDTYISDGWALVLDLSQKKLAFEEVHNDALQAVMQRAPAHYHNN